MSQGEIMIKLDDLELGLEFNSSGPYSDNEVYIDSETGQVIYVSDIIDEEPPSDIYENDKYIMLPTKQELGLGKPLPLEFAREQGHDFFNEVYSIFASRGAYSRFKGLLEHKGLLEQWYNYEQEHINKALMAWCSDNDIECK